MFKPAVVAFTIMATGSAALAHIHLTSPLSRTDDPQGNPQKEQHCGTVGWVRADHPERVQVFQPGQTITVTWAETINHPGWYRIAVQPEGEVFGIPPPAVGGGFPDVAQPGLDAVNGSIVLADRIPDGMLSMDVTLPDIECTNCTLQFIQVMTDKAPYTVDALSDDIYFNCSDITISATAPDAGPQPTVDAAPGAGPDAGPGGPGVTPGGSTTGDCMAGGGGLGPLAALGLLALRRRRRS